MELSKDEIFTRFKNRVTCATNRIVMEKKSPIFHLYNIKQSYQEESDRYNYHYTWQFSDRDRSINPFALLFAGKKTGSYSPYQFREFVCQQLGCNLRELAAFNFGAKGSDIDSLRKHKDDHWSKSYYEFGKEIRSKFSKRK